MAPLLGRMHQVVHAPGWWGGSPHAAHDAQAARQAYGPGVALPQDSRPLAAEAPDSQHLSAAAAAHAVVPTGIDTPHALFAGHAVADCQLLDHLLLGGALVAGATAHVHAAPADAPATQVARPAGVRRLAHFLARAPPPARA